MSIRPTAPPISQQTEFLGREREAWTPRLHSHFQSRLAGLGPSVGLSHSTEHYGTTGANGSRGALSPVPSARLSRAAAEAWTVANATPRRGRRRGRSADKSEHARRIALIDQATLHGGNCIPSTAYSFVSYSFALRAWPSARSVRHFRLLWYPSHCGALRTHAGIVHNINSYVLLTGTANCGSSPGLLNLPCRPGTPACLRRAYAVITGNNAPPRQYPLDTVPVLVRRK